MITMSKVVVVSLVFVIIILCAIGEVLIDEMEEKYIYKEEKYNNIGEKNGKNILSNRKKWSRKRYNSKRVNED